MFIQFIFYTLHSTHESLTNAENFQHSIFHSFDYVPTEVELRFIHKQ